MCTDGMDIEAKLCDNKERGLIRERRSERGIIGMGDMLKVHDICRKMAFFRLYNKT